MMMNPVFCSHVGEREREKKKITERENLGERMFARCCQSRPATALYEREKTHAADRAVRKAQQQQQQYWLDRSANRALAGHWAACCSVCVCVCVHWLTQAAHLRQRKTSRASRDSRLPTGRPTLKLLEPRGSVEASKRARAQPTACAYGASQHDDESVL